MTRRIALVALAGGVLFGGLASIDIIVRLRGVPSDSGLVLLVVGMPIALTTFGVALVGLRVLIATAARIHALVPDMEVAFEDIPRVGRWRTLAGSYLDVLGLYTGGRRSASAAARGFSAIIFTAVMLGVDAVFELPLNAGARIWTSAPQDPIAFVARTESLAVLEGAGRAAFVLSAFLAAGTLVGLVRAGGERSTRDRALVTICYVLADVAWFILLYHAGSVGDLTQFVVAPASSVEPLSIWQSVLLAVGTLTTAGAPGITPVNELARIAISFELLTLAILGSWFIGVYEALRTLGRPWWETDEH